MSPQLAWYHVMFSTYGSWLYGDPRGFRTRHHREHVEGDYKNPPPEGLYADKERRSRALLKQAPVSLPVPLRAVVGTSIKERLEGLGYLVIALTVTAQHVHVLVKLPLGDVREHIGVAKKHAWFVLRQQHLWRGKLWGKRCQCVLVRDRTHQLNVYRYIGKHVDEGGWVWLWEHKQQSAQ